MIGGDRLKNGQEVAVVGVLQPVARAMSQRLIHDPLPCIHQETHDQMDGKRGLGTLSQRSDRMNVE